MNKITSFTGSLERIHRLHNPPKELFTEGANLESILKKPVVAVVGTRKPTPYGKQVTEDIVSSLSRQGIVIVSGLAFGIDILAHSSCLEQGGTTIAVLPSGLSSIYPASHRHIAKKITEKGCLVSEYENNVQPMKHQFIARNRIIASLADAVLIPEATVQSGSLHTANFALDMGIPVCAVPGQITHPSSEGTNQLIKQGAFVVTSYQDVLHVLGIESRPNSHIVIEGKTPSETRLLQLLQQGINDAGTLQANSQLSSIEFQQTMTMLEITGRVRSGELGTWHLIA